MANQSKTNSNGSAGPATAASRSTASTPAREANQKKSASGSHVATKPGQNASSPTGSMGSNKGQRS